jgi:hypothetical protein
MGQSSLARSRRRTTQDVARARHGLLWSACLAASLTALGCESKDAASDAAAASDTGASPSGAAPPLFGYFAIDLIAMTPATPVRSAAAARTAFIGQIKDGVEPEPYPWALDVEEGDCKLLVPDQPFCDPLCSSTAECVEDGVCIDQPTPQSIGTVHVIGLGAERDVEDLVTGKYQLAAGTTLPYPPCREGDEVRLEAEGGDHAPFELSTRCVPPMEFPGPVLVEPGQPLSLTWTAPAVTDLSHVSVHLDISHHGGKRGLIECEVTDTGSLVIAASLIDGLLALGVSGFHSIVLERKSAAGTGSTSASERITFTIRSRRENLVVIPGLSSCGADAECPDGQRCQSDFRCQ